MSDLPSFKEFMKNREGVCDMCGKKNKVEFSLFGTTICNRCGTRKGGSK